MAGQQAASREAERGASRALAAQGRGWKPSRFFDAWKESVRAAEGGLVMQYMHYCRGMPADAKKRAVDYILRGTIPVVYVSTNRSEAFDAMDNDADAAREYASRFLDKFWKEYWAEFVAKYPAARCGGRGPA